MSDATEHERARAAEIGAKVAAALDAGFESRLVREVVKTDANGNVLITLAAPALVLSPFTQSVVRWRDIEETPRDRHRRAGYKALAAARARGSQP